MTLRIGIAGISGRMGQMLTQEVTAAGATLIGGICRPGEDPKGATIFEDIAALAAACDLVVCPGKEGDGWLGANFDSIMRHFGKIQRRCK